MSSMLLDVPGDAKLLGAYRAGLIEKNCGIVCAATQRPSQIAVDELDAFVNCFVEKLISIQP